MVCGFMRDTFVILNYVNNEKDHIIWRAQRGQAPLRPKVLIYYNYSLFHAVILRLWSYI